MLTEFSKDSKDNSSVNARNMFDLELITYKEYIVIRNYVLDKGL